MRKWTKKELLKHISYDTAIIIGTILLALGTAMFLTESNIIAGGLSGVGIIIQSFVEGEKIIDIVVAILTVLLWFVGWFIVGKEFALRTLLASIAYPIFFSLFMRIPFFTDFAKDIAGNKDVGHLLLCSIFGGILIGAGVALTFLGGGSTGGVDVLIFVIEKYAHIKESLASFIVDGSIVLVGMICFAVRGESIIPSLCGILSAFITATMIDAIYNGSQSAYQFDIISDKWEEISRYAQDDLGRGATIIHAEGGYKGDERIILRVVIDRTQYSKMRNYLAKTDSKAFVTIARTNATYGEGFKSNTIEKK